MHLPFARKPWARFCTRRCPRNLRERRAVPDAVDSVQKSCAAGQVVLSNVPPGSYVIAVDSCTVTPAVRGTAPATVDGGEDAYVSVDPQERRRRRQHRKQVEGAGGR